MWKDKKRSFDSNSAMRSSVREPLDEGFRMPFADDAFRNTGLNEEVWHWETRCFGVSSCAASTDKAAVMAQSSPGRFRSVLISHTHWVLVRNWVPAVKTQIYELFLSSM